MPSSFGMFVYRLLTSIVRRMILSGSLSFSEKIRRRKFVESLTYDLMWFISGFRKWSAYSDSLAVGPSHPDIIGLPGTSALCIFGNRYSVGFRVELSTRRNLWVL